MGIRRSRRIDGILHISDMSWGRIIIHPRLCSGRENKVVVEVDAERSEFPRDETIDSGSLAHRRRKIFRGRSVQGKVISLMDYGAFVELESGIEGLIHISEMSWTRKISHPSKVLQVGRMLRLCPQRRPRATGVFRWD